MATQIHKMFVKFHRRHYIFILFVIIAVVFVRTTFKSSIKSAAMQATHQSEAKVNGRHENKQQTSNSSKIDEVPPIVLWWTSFIDPVGFKKTCGSHTCRFTGIHEYLNHAQTKVKSKISRQFFRFSFSSRLRFVSKLQTLSQYRLYCSTVQNWKLAKCPCRAIHSTSGPCSTKNRPKTCHCSCTGRPWSTSIWPPHSADTVTFHWPYNTWTAMRGWSIHAICWTFDRKTGCSVSRMLHQFSTCSRYVTQCPIVMRMLPSSWKVSASTRMGNVWTTIKRCRKGVCFECPLIRFYECCTYISGRSIDLAFLFVCTPTMQFIGRWLLAHTTNWGAISIHWPLQVRHFVWE